MGKKGDREIDVCMTSSGRGNKPVANNSDRSSSQELSTV